MAKNRKLTGPVDFQEAVEEATEKESTIEVELPDEHGNAVKTQVAVNELGIPKDPEAAVAAVKQGVIKLTADPDKVDEGIIVETYAITVKTKVEDKEVVHYEEKKQPFAWRKVVGLGAVLNSEGAKLSDETLEFIGKSLTDPKDAKERPIEKACNNVVEIYNSNTRANAKGADYQRILNLKAPMTEETKDAKAERMIAMFMSMNKLSYDKARAKMEAAGIIQAKNK